MRQSPARAILILLIICIAHPRAEADSSNNKAAASPTGPRIILIIRHAEKPEDSKEPKDSDLSKRGFERAAALAKVIPSNFPRPDFLIATKRSAHSNRPMETIEPLSKALHEEIELSFKDEEYAELARKVMTDPKYIGKVVLIAWHHGKIPELAHTLGASEAPAKWNSKVFDRVWEIDYAGGSVSWKDLPERALPGDSEQ